MFKKVRFLVSILLALGFPAQAIAQQNVSIGGVGIITAPGSSGSGGSGITALTGDVTAAGTGSVPATLASVITPAGPIGSTTTTPIITFDAKGRLTLVTSGTIAFPVTTVFGRSGTVVSAANDYSFAQLSGSLAATQLPAFTGDVTSSAGASVLTLASTITAAGPIGSTTVVPVITYDAKGRLTTVTTASIAFPVTSFNSRTGAVAPATNDYSFAQLSGSLASTQMPALSGGVTSSAGSTVTTLRALTSADIATALTTPGPIGGTTPNTIKGTSINDTALTASLPVVTDGGKNLASATQLGSSAELNIDYQPGLITAVASTKSAFSKFVKASTLDNLEVSAAAATCTVNATITLYECGTSTGCATPTAMGSATVVTAGTVVDGTLTSTAITAGDYVAWAISAGTCTSLDIAATAQIHAN